MQKRRTPLSLERGSSMLEFSLVCGVFLFLLLTFLDFMRIISMQVVMTAASQKGLQLAQRLPGAEFDIREEQRDGPLYRRFVAARSQVIAAATNTPLLFAASSSSPKSAMQLIGFRQRDRISTEVLEWPQSGGGFDAVLIRPGEQAQHSQGEFTVDHPTICPPVGMTPYSKRCSAPNVRRISSNDKWTTLLRENPIMVELCATVDMLLPGFPDLRTCRRAVGFRIVPYTADPGPGSYTPETLVCDLTCPGKAERVEIGCDCHCPMFGCLGNLQRVGLPTCDCVCPASSPSPCPTNHIWNDDPAVCKCVCPLSGSCPAGYFWDRTVCGCRPLPPTSTSTTSSTSTSTTTSSSTTSSVTSSTSSTICTDSCVGASTQTLCQGCDEDRGSTQCRFEPYWSCSCTSNCRWERSCYLSGPGCPPLPGGGCWQFCNDVWTCDVSCCWEMGEVCRHVPRWVWNECCSQSTQCTPGRTVRTCGGVVTDLGTPCGC